MTYNIPPGRTLAQNSIGGSVTSGFDEGLFRVGLGVGVDVFGVNKGEGFTVC